MRASFIIPGLEVWQGLVKHTRSCPEPSCQQLEGQTPGDAPFVIQENRVGLATSRISPAQPAMPTYSIPYFVGIIYW